MAPYFPRHTGAQRVVEPEGVRRLTMSLVQMAVATGVVVRVVRAVVLTHGPSQSVLYLGAAVGLVGVFLLGMAALHLGNFTLRRWLWRAPLFGLVEGAAEALTGLALIQAGGEPLGSTRAAFADWPRMAAVILVTRPAIVIVFAAVLAGVVQAVRYALLKREHREGMAAAVAHED